MYKRQEQNTPAAEKMALRAARRWDRVEKLARGGLGVGGAISKVTSDGAMRGLTRAARKFVSADLVPEWGEKMPPSAEAKLPATSIDSAAAVYMPACINRMFGRSKADDGDLSLPEALTAVSARAGKPVWIPDDVSGTCCSVPWSSKGYRDAHAFKANQTVERLWRWTGGGTLPVVIDATSCGHGLQHPGPGVLTEENETRHAAIRIIDSVEWAESFLLPELEVKRKVASATVHPTCSGRHMGVDRALDRLTGELADGWLPIFLSPERDKHYRDCLAEGFARASGDGAAGFGHACARRDLRLQLRRPRRRLGQLIVRQLRQRLCHQPVDRIQRRTQRRQEAGRRGRQGRGGHGSTQAATTDSSDPSVHYSDKCSKKVTCRCR